MLQNYRKLKRKTIPIHGGFSNETMTIKIAYDIAKLFVKVESKRDKTFLFLLFIKIIHIAHSFLCTAKMNSQL